MPSFISFFAFCLVKKEWQATESQMILFFSVWKREEKERKMPVRQYSELHVNDDPITHRMCLSNNHLMLYAASTTLPAESLGILPEIGILNK